MRLQPFGPNAEPVADPTADRLHRQLPEAVVRNRELIGGAAQRGLHLGGGRISRGGIAARLILDQAPSLGGGLDANHSDAGLQPSQRLGFELGVEPHHPPPGEHPGRRPHPQPIQARGGPGMPARPRNAATTLVVSSVGDGTSAAPLLGTAL